MTIRTAEAGTARSSLDLLGLPFALSQNRPMTVSEFAKFAGQHRSWAMRRLPPVNEQVLEELHRCGVLVPLFRVDLTPGPDAQPIDLSASLTAQHVHTTVIGELFRGASEGRAIDPAVVEFEAWPRDRSRPLWPSVESGFLYSCHQILGLDVAMHFVSELKQRRTGERVTWHLEEASLPNEPTRRALGSWRNLATSLSALDTYYWPRMRQMVRYGFDVWQAALQAFDPAQMLTWLGVSLDQIERQATSLRATAAFCDDMGTFYDLIRRARARDWDSLRGDAATAMDYRVAADILDRFAEELNPGSDYAAGHSAPLDQQGLSARSESLDAVLTEQRLSPFPSLVIGVEGATEYKLVPRVMDLLGIERDRNRIELIDFGGTDRDLSLLARYAGEPVLGRDLGTGMALDRPLTRFLIMTDAEHKYASAADRRYQRKLLLDSLTANVPADLRSDYYSNTLDSRVVEIRTWGKLPFEFAHFKDWELADAMLGIAVVPHPHGRSRLINAIHMQRTHDPTPNVDDVFWRGSRLSKTALAEALWPVLEAHCRQATERGRPGPPVMRAVIRAYEMATAPYRSDMMLRRRRWRPRR